jgi:hypothetical protein
MHGSPRRHEAHEVKKTVSYVGFAFFVLFVASWWIKVFPTMNQYGFIKKGIQNEQSHG